MSCSALKQILTKVLLTTFNCFYSIPLKITLLVCFYKGTQRKQVIIALFVKRFKYFMTEVPILLKPVHQFSEQINGSVSV